MKEASTSLIRQSFTLYLPLVNLQDLENIDFHLKDVIELTLDKKYDVITCAYALVFLAEAHKVLQTLVSLLIWF
jgi:2-polyprenyl-3-methyl-5-hydroxy-6-metoxy-1,4-benzoquinol methylase